MSNGTLNLLWPGSSWASIACGTQYQMLIQEQNYQIGHILGASGGAASAVMTLADPEPASLNVLRATYAAHGKACDFSTPCWKGVYQDLLEGPGSDAGAFARVKRYGKVALVCDAPKANTHYVLYNFTDAEQAAQAYAASGGSGPVKGVGNCKDGGAVKQQFPSDMAADSLSYFATSSPEGPSGAAAFPLFCPGFLGDVILVSGFNCIDWLTNQSAIEPEKYTVLGPSADPGISGLAPFGTKGIWRDCGTSIVADGSASASLPAPL